MPSILKDWVTHLGLRHQGVLMACVRAAIAYPRKTLQKPWPVACEEHFLTHSIQNRPASSKTSVK